MRSTTAPPAVAIEDRLGIHDLVAEYSWRCDTNDLGAISDLFAEGGIWDEQVLGAPRCEGRGAVHTLFQRMVDAEIPFIVHIISNERITAFDGITAQGTCHLK